MKERCPNCSAPLGGNFCAQCGQRVDDHRRKLSSLIRDVLDEWFSLDAKLPRSLRRLFQPGRLSELWVAGKRTSYVSPWRLYLLASIVVFFVFNLEPPDASKMTITVAGKVIAEPVEPLEGRKASVNLFDADPQSYYGRLERIFLADRIERLQAAAPQELVDGVFNGFRATLPTTLIFFLPLFAAALKLLYWRSAILYVDHLVLALHFQAFLLVGLIATGVTGWGGWIPFELRLGLYALLFALIVPVYLAVALRRFYRQSWPWSLLKTLFVVFAYVQVAKVVLTVTIIWIVYRI